MSSERYQRVGEIYDVALELEPAARPNFLVAACQGDDELRGEVETLLAAREKADGFIAGRIAGVVAAMAAHKHQRHQSIVGQLIGHYQIVSLLGEGGMSEVYLAQDTRLDRKVALKLLPPEYTIEPERMARFKREARAVSALNHPNILTIYEVGVAGENHFLATEFIDGQSLRERLVNGRLEVSESLEIAIQIATALTAAHEAGIVHRDIKPDNVMIRRDGIVKVLDFGLAKLIEKDPIDDSNLGITERLKRTTAQGRVIGTPQYMSPEQALGERIDARSDIFSLGVVLYEMLTGFLPFAGAKPIETMAAIINREPARLNELVATIPVELQEIIDQALRKNRDERFQTTKSFLHEMKALKTDLAFSAKLKDENQSVSLGKMHSEQIVSVPTIGTAAVEPSAKIGFKSFNRRLSASIALILAAAALIGLYWRKHNNEATTNQQQMKRPAVNLRAFQAYTQGRVYSHRRTREDLFAAVRSLEEAIAEDPNYALAYSGLADAYTNLGFRSYILPAEGRRKAEEAARKALALDDNLADAHAALGQVETYFAPYNFAHGDQELRRAIELSPGSALTHTFLGISLLRQGRFDEGLEAALKARMLDPLSPAVAYATPLAYYLKRDYVRALEMLRRVHEVGPVLTAHTEIGIYIHNRLYDEALAELEKAKRSRNNDPILIQAAGRVYAAQGRGDAARQIIKELEVMSGPELGQAHWIAKIYADLNEKPLALSWLERGVEAGSLASFFKDEPVWDPLRSEPRFAELLRRLGISN